MAVALGAPSDSLKWLSAWKAQSADAYVRTSRIKTIQIQTTVARLLRLHMGGGDPVGEQQALEELGYHLAERGIEQAEIERVVGALTVFPKEGVVTTLWTSLAERTDHGSGPSASSNPSEPSPEGGPSGGKQDAVKDSSEESDSAPSREGYVVAISRNKGRRCLHKIGLCYRRPGVHYKQFRVVGSSRPATSEYDDYCRDCWRSGPPRDGTTTAERLGSDTGSSRRTSSASTTSSSSAA